MNTQLYRSFKDKLRLNTSIIVVKWLAKQSCTFRGHDELANLENQGNFGEMIELATKYSKESIEVFLQNSPLYAKCTTSNIQKKLLNILANKVRNKINEAPDESNKEQVAIILRYVECERLIDIFSVVCKVLVRLVECASNNGMCGEAKCVFETMTSFKFIFILHLLNKVLGVSNLLCQTL
ncbi:hypothetical protein CICLE_v10006562mg [Citrus x clementina]|uniref:DUF4371 domain-containing protein n=1 Tax=Citrus clementina TaxID=85681 RepID=V4S2A0_CITCL|nr:hypothetical protein CICLE_v10006562mg [Citrus x clementina]